ncbi:MAG: hypothetical protein V4472_26835, partial [Pseudomonadota bacterium]
RYRRGASTPSVIAPVTGKIAFLGPISGHFYVNFSFSINILRPDFPVIAEQGISAPEQGKCASNTAAEKR